MTKILQYSENQKIFNTDEDVTSSPKDKAVKKLMHTMCKSNIQTWRCCGY